ncbi:unnamed protein product, partial [Adineta ricciae]
MLRRLYPDIVDIVTIDTLARNLQSVWLYYELTNFIFMTSKLKEISYPYAIAEKRNLNWIYHIFTVFWSNHEDIFGSCKCGHCSRVIILDGHQKPRRLVCKYDNVTSLVNINELGPLNKGCPYMPQRRQSDKRESN